MRLHQCENAARFKKFLKRVDLVFFTFNLSYLSFKLNKQVQIYEGLESSFY